MKKWKIVLEQEKTGLKTESPPVFTKKQAKEVAKNLTAGNSSTSYSAVPVENIEYETYFST